MEGQEQLSEGVETRQQIIDKYSDAVREGRMPDQEEIAELEKACSISGRKGAEKGIKAGLTAEKLPGTFGGGPIVTP